MARIKTFVNGGSLLPGDLDLIQDDYEGAYSCYRTLWFMSGGLAGGPGTNGTYVVNDRGSAIGDTQNAVPYGAIYLDPADLAVPNRSAKLRLRTALFTNATAIATNITPGLYPIASVAGSSGNNTGTLGTVVTGSAGATFTTPAASSRLQVVTSDFTPPTAGWYALGFLVLAAMAAGSSVALTLTLQYRQT
jgi:hypothetical protein